MSTFGYMIFLIFVKWSNDYEGKTDKAPSILTIMMDFGLKLGAVEGESLYGAPD